MVVTSYADKCLCIAIAVDTKLSSSDLVVIN